MSEGGGDEGRDEDDRKSNSKEVDKIQDLGVLEQGNGDPLKEEIL